MSDLISRQAAIDAIERLILPQTKGETAAEEINRVAWRCAINCAEEMIGHLPTIDPVRHGTWLKYPGDIVSDDGLWGETLYDCSECGHTRHVATEFCSKCGAKMEQDGEIQVRWKDETD